MSEDYSGLSQFEDYNTVQFVRIINGLNEKRGITKDVLKTSRGKFFVGGEVKETLEIVPLLFQRKSTFFEGRFPNSTLACFSNNFFEPAAGTPIHHTCRAINNGRVVHICPKALSKECKENIDFYFIDKSTGALSMLGMHGMNLYNGSPFRNFMMSLRQSGEPPYRNSFTISTVCGDKVFSDMPKADSAMLLVLDKPNLLDKVEVDEYREQAKALWGTLSRKSTVNHRQSPRNDDDPMPVDSSSPF